MKNKKNMINSIFKNIIDIVLYMPLFDKNLSKKQHMSFLKVSIMNSFMYFMLAMVFKEPNDYVNYDGSLNLLYYKFAWVATIISVLYSINAILHVLHSIHKPIHAVTTLIKSEKEYEELVKRIDKLMDALPFSKEGDELELLCLLVSKYEDDKYKLPQEDTNKLEQDNIITISKNDATRCIWDAILLLQYVDENWSDKDTCDLILRKLLGKEKIELATGRIPCLGIEDDYSKQIK